MRGVPLNDDLLHRRFFRKSDHAGRLRIVQKDLAEELQLKPETICRLLKRMEGKGMLKRIRSEKNNIGVYAISDPDTPTQTTV